MKRKIFNMFMVGALVFPSASMFVSCKDYDDDINNLQQQIDELSKTIKAIQDQIAAGSVITSVTPTGNGVTITLSNNKTFTITNGKDGAAGKDGTAWTIGTDGYWYKDGAKTTYYALGTKGDAGAAGATGHYFVPNVDGSWDEYDSNNTKVANRKDIPSWKSKDADAITAVKDGDKLTLTNVDGAGDTKTVVINLSCKLAGLVFNPLNYYKGIQAADYAQYTYYAVSLSDKGDDDKLGNPDSLKTPHPDLKLTYSLNPSNAKVYSDMLKYQFCCYNASTRSSSDEPNLKATSVDTTKAGKVTVTAKVTGKLATDYGKVSLFALQYTNDKDDVITSDFAAIRTSYRSELQLCDSTNTPLAEKAGLGLAYDVKYDASVDLRRYVSLSMLCDRESVSPWYGSKPDDLKKMKDAGFRLVFKIMPKEGQTSHAKIDNEYTLTADGRPSSVGQNVLVRACLMNGNSCAAVGYFRVNLTKTVTSAADLSFNTDYNVASNENVVLTMDYSTIETGILDVYGLNQSVFANNYTIGGTVYNVTQYAKNNSGEYVAATKPIGDVSLVDGKFNWRMSSATAYNLLKAGSSVDTYVRYEKKPESAATNDYLYVHLIWTPKEKYVTPTSVDLNDYKVNGAWDVNNELHYTAEGANNATAEIIGKALNEISYKDGVYSSKLNTVVTKLYFNASQAVKGFVVDNDLISVKKDGVTIAKIEDGNITYVNNSTAQEVLNNDDAKFSVVAKATIGSAQAPITVTNNTFVVKFASLIHDVSCKPVSFTDIESEETTAGMLFTTTAQTYDRWGVTSINVETSKATSDAGLDVTGMFKYNSDAVTYSAKDGGYTFGTLTYKGAGIHLSKDITVKIPVIVNYNWGEFKTNLTVTVKKSANAAKRN